MNTFTSTTSTSPGVPFLDFERTTEILDRLHAQPVPPSRQQVGSIEIVAGTIPDGGSFLDVALAIDPVTGAAIVCTWAQSAGVE